MYRMDMEQRHHHHHTTTINSRSVSAYTRIESCIHSHSSHVSLVHTEILPYYIFNQKFTNSFRSRWFVAIANILFSMSHTRTCEVRKKSHHHHIALTYWAIARTHAGESIQRQRLSAYPGMRRKKPEKSNGISVCCALACRQSARIYTCAGIQHHASILRAQHL